MNKLFTAVSKMEGPQVRLIAFIMSMAAFVVYAAAADPGGGLIR